MQEEIWKDVVGYEGYYQVSSYGRVKSLTRTVVYLGKFNRTIFGIYPKIYKDKDGYEIVALSRDKKTKSKRVHRLVAEAFIPNIENKPEVDHIDTIRDNNFFTNLRWATTAENVRQGWINKTHMGSWTGRYGKDNYFSKPVVMLSKNNEFIKEYFSQTEAANEVGVGSCNISMCCNNKLNTAGGYRWMFATDYYK